jgi:hypothetical protein
MAEIAGEEVDREAGGKLDRRQVGGGCGLREEPDAAGQDHGDSARPAGTAEAASEHARSRHADVDHSLSFETLPEPAALRHFRTVHRAEQ